MARIIAFSTSARRPPPPVRPAEPAGELVAMQHINLDTVVKTVGFLRDIGRGHLLDSFNRQSSPGEPPESAAP